MKATWGFWSWFEGGWLQSPVKQFTPGGLSVILKWQSNTCRQKYGKIGSLFQVLEALPPAVLCVLTKLFLWAVSCLATIGKTEIHVLKVFKMWDKGEGEKKNFWKFLAGKNNDVWVGHTCEILISQSMIQRNQAVGKTPRLQKNAPTCCSVLFRIKKYFRSVKFGLQKGSVGSLQKICFLFYDHWLSRFGAMLRNHQIAICKLLLSRRKLCWWAAEILERDSWIQNSLVCCSYEYWKHWCHPVLLNRI